MTVPLTFSTQATFHTNDDALTMAFGLLFGGMIAHDSLQCDSLRLDP